ncbi:GNAT family N-acetyltransferase [Exiguobacterium sp. TRN 1102]|uniref:GNAT family N-acetyltransferase n=1 Tax=Exiguobacterium sp. TRN 1102 TaxID=3420732 RepID=UPI003D7772E8
MNSITLKSLSIDDQSALHLFECENRSYFERFVPSRGDTYYDSQGFNHALDRLLTEQIEGKGRYYLIWNNDTIIGRMNVHSSRDGVGEVGYRIGEDYSGRGYATSALRQLLALHLPEYVELIAETLTNHHASRRVLMRAGFTRNNQVRQVEWEGQTLSFYTFVYRFMNR